MKTRIILMLTCVACLTGACFAQADAGGVISDDELMAVLEQLTPEQLSAVMNEASQRRMESERQQTLDEIQQNILYEEEQIAIAEALLNDKPKHTRVDNIDRMLKAYSVVDVAFAQAVAAMDAKEYAKATKALKQLAAPESSTIRSAAAMYLLGDALVKQGNVFGGTEIWQQLLANQPDRVSLAAEVALRSARAYQSIGRGMYALEMYVYCLNNYSLSMSKAEVEKIYAKAEALQERYRDPIKTVTLMMADVQERLGRSQTGDATQEKQHEVVAMLDDLIKTTEEKNRQKNQQEKKDQERKNRENQGKKPGECKKPGEGQQPGKQPGNPSGQKPGGTGAKNSSLVPGPVSKPNLLTRKHSSDDTGKWAELPARDREQIRELMRQRLSERRGGHVRDYHRKLAEDGNE